MTNHNLTPVLFQENGNFWCSCSQRALTNNLPTQFNNFEQLWRRDVTMWKNHSLVVFHDTMDKVPRFQSNSSKLCGCNCCGISFEITPNILLCILIHGSTHVATLEKNHCQLQCLLRLTFILQWRWSFLPGDYSFSLVPWSDILMQWDTFLLPT